MQIPQTFVDVIDLWPSRPELARDLGFTIGRVQKWADRNKIPPEHWNILIKAAGKRGYWQVTPRRLTTIAENSARS